MTGLLNATTTCGAEPLRTQERSSAIVTSLNVVQSILNPQMATHHLEQSIGGWSRCLTVKMMLLYMSSGRIEYLGRLPDDRVDFASDIAFETADDFDLAHSFCGSSTHICLGAQLVA